jgi:hypothetical protein
MRTVLIGSDFMYDKNGVLKPIEINTAVTWHRNKIEVENSTIDLTELNSFISTNGITKVVYIGHLYDLSKILHDNCTSLNIDYEKHMVLANAITIPYVEDNDTTLIIRSAYDTTALVDDTYCKDKINFLNLIKDSAFGTQFVYLNDANTIVNNITTINDNGNHPNFILKARLPQYDKTIYPKFYKVTNQDELNTLISNVVTSDYFLMEFLYNPNELIENHIKVFRGLNILFPPNLESISLGGYTRTCDDTIEEDSSFDPTTFELIGSRYKYLSDDYNTIVPKLLKTDYVEMADGSFKVATDLVVGDLLKTIDIPNPFEIDNADDTANYRISLSELEAGTTYSSNRITNIIKTNALTHTTKLTFTDNTDWFDNMGSRYLAIRNNEIRFLGLNQSDDEFSLKIGDSIILLDTTNSESTTFVVKEVSNIEEITQFFGGFEITVERAHLFLTKAAVDSNSSYVSIEHNLPYCYSSGTTCQQSSCNKGNYCVDNAVSRMSCNGRCSCGCYNQCAEGIGKS